MTPNRRTFLLFTGAAAVSRLGRAQYVLPAQACRANGSSIARTARRDPAKNRASKPASRTFARKRSRTNCWSKPRFFTRLRCGSSVSTSTSAKRQPIRRWQCWTSASPARRSSMPAHRRGPPRPDGSFAPSVREWMAAPSLTSRPFRPRTTEASRDAWTFFFTAPIAEWWRCNFSRQPTSPTTSRSPCRPPDFLQIEVFGRTNVAYRWAGETDAFECVEAARKNYAVDENRITLRGFSMGGSGTWHLGLQHPDHWAANGTGRRLQRHAELRPHAQPASRTN